jgi:cell cycle serine/threonine-protein kinase CDC5/MSD2
MERQVQESLPEQTPLILAEASLDSVVFQKPPLEDYFIIKTISETDSTKVTLVKDNNGTDLVLKSITKSSFFSPPE